MQLKTLNFKLSTKKGTVPTRFAQAKGSEGHAQHSTSEKQKLSAGFTLVELTIVVSIIALFSTILLVRHSEFGSAVSLNSLAHETGLAIREAQVFGISVREQGAEQFDRAYGVRFSMANPQEFVSFIDISGDGFYDPSFDVLLNSYTIRRGNRISDLCAVSYEFTDPNCGRDSIDITFIRPNPNASFEILPTPSFEATEVEIYLTSPKGASKKVSVSATGQIVVQNVSSGASAGTEGGEEEVGGGEEGGGDDGGRQ